MTNCWDANFDDFTYSLAFKAKPGHEMMNARNFSAKLKRRNCAVAYAAAPAREFGKAVTQK